jgi:hypothetical protein
MAPDDEESDDTAENDEVPEGAAVLPLIPEELHVHPLLLAVLHAVVFLDGSDPDVVNPAAASEALEYIAGYLQRLSRGDLDRVRTDLTCLVEMAREEKWDKDGIEFFKHFLAEFGVK